MEEREEKGREGRGGIGDRKVMKSVNPPPAETAPGSQHSSSPHPMSPYLRKGMGVCFISKMILFSLPILLSMGATTVSKVGGLSIMGTEGWVSRSRRRPVQESCIIVKITTRCAT